MNLSPYQFAKVLAKELGHSIPPQMVYNYIKKGWIVAETNDLGKKFITPDEQDRVVEVMKTRQAARDAKATAETE
jgi:hypothetical protein